MTVPIKQIEKRFLVKLNRGIIATLYELIHSPERNLHGFHCPYFFKNVLETPLMSYTEKAITLNSSKKKSNLLKKAYRGFFSKSLHSQAFSIKLIQKYHETLF